MFLWFNLWHTTSTYSSIGMQNLIVTHLYCESNGFWLSISRGVGGHCFLRTLDSWSCSWWLGVVWLSDVEGSEDTFPEWSNLIPPLLYVLFRKSSSQETDPSIIESDSNFSAASLLFASVVVVVVVCYSSPCVYNLAAILRKTLNGGSAIVRMGENGQLNRQFCVCINNQSLALQLLYSCFLFCLPQTR